jgi:glycosyltransferase involved in cell wall biosynthesis
VDRLEVLLVDGMSTDGTRVIVEEFAHNHNFIKLVDNPDRITPKALNIGIRAAKGDIILRMDAHATYERDYISKSVRYLREYNADNVGGVMQTVSRDNSVMGKAIAAVMSSRFGVGDSTFRIGANSIREVQTVFGGCYPKAVFDKIGLFNEQFRRGQDREFNFRLRRAGGKIILAPDIRCTYYARSSLSAHMKHVFASGGVAFSLTRATQSKMYSWRNLVPLSFVLVLAGLLALSLLSSWFLGLFLVIIAGYLVTAILASAVSVIRKEKDIRLMVVMPVVFMLTHVVYGISSLVGIFTPIHREGMRSKT